MKNGIINLSRDFWKKSFTSSTSAAAAIAGNVQVKPKLSKSTTKCPTKAIMIKLSCKDFASVNLSTEEVAANSGCVAISTRLWDSCNDHLNKSSMCVHCTLCNGSGRIVEEPAVRGESVWPSWCHPGSQRSRTHRAPANNFSDHQCYIISFIIIIVLKVNSQSCCNHR